MARREIQMAQEDVALMQALFTLISNANITLMALQGQLNFSKGEIVTRMGLNKTPGNIDRKVEFDLGRGIAIVEDTPHIVTSTNLREAEKIIKPNG